MFDFFFDTADDQYILNVWDKAHKHLDAKNIRGITTNPNAFKKVDLHKLGEWEAKLPVLCSLVSELRGDAEGVVYVQAPVSTMTPEEVYAYVKHISQFNDGKTKIGLKIPPFRPILEMVDDLNQYAETNVTGLADCSTALSCLSYNVKYISLIPGRMEEKGIDAKSHVLFTRRRNHEGQPGAGEIIAGSMRTLEGLEWVCSHGTIPTIGTRVWDQIIADEETLRSVAAYKYGTVGCDNLMFSPQISETNTQLSVDFFAQMDECGRQAHADFMTEYSEALSK